MGILDHIQKGKSNLPPRLVVYGEHGIGKSTFAADAPAPVFIRTEDGLANIEADAFPVATSWQEIVDQVGAIITEEHEYKTLVLDSLDHLEPLIWQKVCDDNSVSSIEGLGYGRGYVEATGLWRRLCEGLDKVRAKGMCVICLAHAGVEKFCDPTAEDYDRFQIKLHKKAAPIMQEWADCVFLAAQKIYTSTTEAGKTKATTTNERVVYTEPRPNHVAKNRFSLPYELPLAWGAFADAYAAATTKKEAK